MTAKAYKDLDVAQLSMASAIVGRKRRPNEGWLEWFERRRREARQRPAAAGIRRWSQVFKLRTRVRASKEAHMDDHSLLARATKWRDLPWWRARQVRIASGERHLCYPGHFTPRRWEALVQSFWTWALGVEPDLGGTWREGALSAPDAFLSRAVRWSLL